MKLSSIQEVEFVKNWYEGYIPSSIDDVFAKFASRSVTMTTDVAFIPIVFSNTAPAAYIDEDGAKAYIPVMYLMKSFFELLHFDDPNDYPLLALTLINGSVIHESCHKRYTKPSVNLIAEFMRYFAFTARKDQVAFLKKTSLDLKYASDSQYTAVDSIKTYSTSIFSSANDVDPSIKNRSEYKRFAHFINQNPIFSRILSIVGLIEDVFIEAACVENFEYLHSFIRAKNAVIFNSEVQQARMAELRKKQKSFEANFEVALCMKNEAFERSPELNEFEIAKKIVSMISEVKLYSINNMMDRFELAVDIYIAIFNLVEHPEPPDTISTYENAKNKNTIDLSSAIEKTMISALKSAQAFDDDDDEDDEDYNSTSSGSSSDNDKLKNEAEEAESIAKSFNKEAGDQAVKILQRKIDNAQDEDEKSEAIQEFVLVQMESQLDASRINPAVMIDLNNVDKSENRHVKLALDSRFLSFARFLSAMREEKKVHGPPSATGGKVSKHHLYRIGIDSKVLVKRTVDNIEIGKPEVILACDQSGSTRSASGSEESRQRHQREITLCQEILEAALGAHNSLKNASIPNSVYGYTTDDAIFENAPIIYGICAYEMPYIGSHGRAVTTHKVETAFNQMLSTHHNENYDGYSLLKISEMFSKTRSDKLLIVLCDGQPSGTFYYGSAADEHTKIAVDYIRSKGITVYCLSLTAHVENDNDMIYGKDFNMKVSNLSVDSALKVLLTRRLA